MELKFYRIAAAICLFVVICGTVAPARADSLPIPTITIAIRHPPKDLKVEFLLANGEWHLGSKRIDPWDTYFVYSDWELDKNMPTAIRASDAGQSIQLTLPQREGKYSSLYALNLEARTLTPDTLPPIAFTLALPRLAVTIVCEGIVFFLFGFRQKRSWFLYLGINVLTQGILNVILYNCRMDELGIALLISLMEAGIIGLETVIVVFAVREQNIARRIICPILANIVSYLAGFAVVGLFPM